MPQNPGQMWLRAPHRNDITVTYRRSKHVLSSSFTGWSALGAWAPQLAKDSALRAHNVSPSTSKALKCVYRAASGLQTDGWHSGKCLEQCIPNCTPLQGLAPDNFGETGMSLFLSYFCHSSEYLTVQETSRLLVTTWPSARTTDHCKNLGTFPLHFRGLTPRTHGQVMGTIRQVERGLSTNPSCPLAAFSGQKHEKVCEGSQARATRLEVCGFRKPPVQQ